MQGISGTAAAKALILAAVPVGAVGFFVTDRWAIGAIVVNLVLLGAGGGLWWKDRWTRLWSRLFPIGYFRGPEAEEDPDDGGTGDDFGDPGSTVFASRRVRRHQLTLSTTSRVRRSVLRRSLTSEQAGRAKDLTMVANTLSQIQGGLQSAQRKARREQLWWLVAGLAASIPVGVAINLATG
ncbi:hypothetical protein KBX53_15950 [Micromonospora sp. M51]|uniref:Uncharacterized protein n=1 Tax=Micromonospora parva TaxID=1464048 RepID=A0ABW6W2V2_9ACTN|nr:hypothetical protein [Micromonospora sp. M51]MBQ1012421.1 hypothetical protein [Micromonospora sp. M51]